MKLSQTMVLGLRKMKLKLDRPFCSMVMAEPNEITGKALEKRGLIKFAGKNSGGWNCYVITDAGLQALPEDKGENG